MRRRSSTQNNDDNERENMRMKIRNKQKIITIMTEEKIGRVTQ